MWFGIVFLLGTIHYCAKKLKGYTISMLHIFFTKSFVASPGLGR